MWLKETGEDLYPKLKETLKKVDPSFWPLSRKLYDTYGYFPSCGDEHIGEYLPFAWEICGTEGPDFAGRSQSVEETWKRYRELVEDGKPLEEYRGGGGKGVFFEEQVEFFFTPRSWVDTLAFPIIDSVYANTLRRMPAVNMVNNGAITNLPADVFVEGPALVDSSGTRLVSVGDMPKPLAAFCRRDIDQVEMMVEAAVSGDRNMILQAMLLDPTVDSIGNSEKILDAMLKANAENLPQFK
jgi:alpha-galactosidase